MDACKCSASIAIASNEQLWILRSIHLRLQPRTLNRSNWTGWRSTWTDWTRDSRNLNSNLLYEEPLRMALRLPCVNPSMQARQSHPPRLLKVQDSGQMPKIVTAKSYWTTAKKESGLASIWPMTHPARRDLRGATTLSLWRTTRWLNCTTRCSKSKFRSLLAICETQWMEVDSLLRRALKSRSKIALAPSTEDLISRQHVTSPSAHWARLSARKYSKTDRKVIHESDNFASMLQKAALYSSKVLFNRLKIAKAVNRSA